MHLYQTVLQSTLYGLCEILPVSYSGHRFLAQMLAQPQSSFGAPEAGSPPDLLSAGAALAMVVLSRRRLARLLAEAVRSIARPSLFRTTAGGRDAVIILMAAPIGVVLNILMEARLAPWSGSPLAVGAGLLITGILVGTLAFAQQAQRPQREHSSLWTGPALGMVVGASIYPGGSRMAAALVLLLHLGYKPSHALDLALMACLPLFAFTCVRTLLERGVGGMDIGMSILGGLLCFLAAMLGCTLLKLLLSRRLAAIPALWLIPLGFGVIAYGRAL